MNYNEAIVTVYITMMKVVAGNLFGQEFMFL